MQVESKIETFIHHYKPSRAFAMAKQFRCYRFHLDYHQNHKEEE